MINFWASAEYDYYWEQGHILLDGPKVEILTKSEVGVEKLDGQKIIIPNAEDIKMEDWDILYSCRYYMHFHEHLFNTFLTANKTADGRFEIDFRTNVTDNDLLVCVKCTVDPSSTDKRYF